MSDNWRKYGPVWVSAGFFITGILWNANRYPSTIRGEDLAECYAGRAERAIAFHVGTNEFRTYSDFEDPDSFSNAVRVSAIYSDGTNLTFGYSLRPGFIPGSMLWPALYDGVLSATRLLAGLGDGSGDRPASLFIPETGAYGGVTNRMWNDFIRQSHDGLYGDILWADHRQGSLYDGQIVLENTCDWVVYRETTQGISYAVDDSFIPPVLVDPPLESHITREYGVGSAIEYYGSPVAWPHFANVVSHVAVTESRYPYEGVVWPGGYSVTNEGFFTKSGFVYALAPGDAYPDAYGGSASPSAEIMATRPWWTETYPSATNAARFACERLGVSNEIVGVDKRIGTNSLHEAYERLSRLTRTFAFYDGYRGQSLVEVLTNMYAGQSAYIGTNSTTLDGDPGVVGDALAGEAFDTACRSPAYVITNSSPGAIFTEELLRVITQSIEVIDGNRVGGEDPQYAYANSAGASIERYLMTLRLHYPSEWALANGYVARVKIFAIPYAAGFFPGVYYGMRPPYIEVEGSMSIDFVFGRPGMLQNSFGLFDPLYLASLPELWQEGITRTESNLYSVLGGWGGINRPSFTTYRVALIHDEVSPSGPIIFTLGYGSIQGQYPVGGSWVSDWSSITTYGYEYGEEYQRTRESQFGMSVGTLGLIIQVDWNWKHCNPDNPYVPEAYTPPWATPP